MAKRIISLCVAMAVLICQLSFSMPVRAEYSASGTQNEHIMYWQNDTYTQSNETQTNYGSSPELLIGALNSASWQGTYTGDMAAARTTYFEVDISNENISMDEVLSVTMNMYIKSIHSNGHGGFRVYRIEPTVSWNKAELTWDTATGQLATPPAKLASADTYVYNVYPIDKSAANYWYSFDITDYIKAHPDEKLFKFMIVGTSSLITMDSSRGTNKPYMKIVTDPAAKCIEAANSIDILSVFPQERITGTTTLPGTYGDGFSVVWTSKNPEIFSIANNVGTIVAQPENNTPVTITATVSKDGYSASRDFTIDVIGSAYNPLTTGLVAYYNFEGEVSGDGQEVVDASGNGKNAVLLENAVISKGMLYLPGGYRTSVGVPAGNGKGGAVKLPNDIIAGITDYTITAWIAPTAPITAVQRLYEFGAQVTNDTSKPHMTRFTSSQILAGERSANQYATYNYTSDELMNKWTHVATTISYKGSVCTAKLYLNGKLVAENSSLSTTNTLASIGSSNFNFIGRSCWYDAEGQMSNNPDFEGYIDEFRFYNIPLVGADIKAVMEAFPANQAKEISISPEILSLKTGETAQLSVTVIPENSPSEVSFISSNPLVASVTADGLLTATYPGTATITAKAKIGGAEGKMTVTVTGKGSEIIKLNDNSAWCWFGDPRAMRHVGTKDQTYIGWVDNTGKIMAASFNHDTKEYTVVTLREYLEADDHDNPTFIALPDNRIMVFYSKHTNEPYFYYRVTAEPEDLTTLLPEQVLSVEGYGNTTYPNPFYLTDDPDYIYLLWRGVNWHPTMAKLTIPDENGVCQLATTPKQIVDTKSINPNDSTRRPYAKYASNGKDTIHIIYTYTHPDNDQNNPIYSVKYVLDAESNTATGKTGALYNTKSEFLSDYESLPYESDRQISHNASVVLADGNRGWTWDLMLDEKGNPVAVYTVISNDATLHQYYYARWNGTEWISTYLCDAGKWFHSDPSREKCYSAGLALDHNNPNVVYVSRPIEGKYGSVYEIEKLVSHDNGATFTERIQITRDSEKNNVRPLTPWNHHDKEFDVLWLNGDYTYWLNSYYTGVTAHFNIDDKAFKTESIHISGSTATVTVRQNNGEAQEAVVVLVAEKNGKINAVKTKTISFNNDKKDIVFENFTYAEGSALYVLILDSMQSLKPLAEKFVLK
mgnify:CR=1 FL=1